MAGGQLAEAWRAKYPGAYDAVPDAELEAAIVAKFPGAYDHLIEPAEEPGAVSRAVGAGVDALKGAAELTGVPGMLREGPVGAVKAQLGGVRGILQSHFDTFRKAQDAVAEGRWSEAAGYTGATLLPAVGPMAARMGEQITSGEVPELIGETLAGAALAGAGPVAGAARRGFQARQTAKAARSMAAAEGDFLMGIPASRSTPYTPADFRTAKPYLNEQHAKKAINTTEGLRDALDESIGAIEGRVTGFVEAFQEAQLNAGEAVARAVAEAFVDNPRGNALKAGLRELEDLPFDRDLTLPELDAVRAQLNAENKAILKRNSYDVATARKADPGFAAREAAARAIRDTLYDYLEARGVKGVRDLRRDEGALIKLRNAADRQVFSGEKAAPGTRPNTVRQALGTLIDRATPLPQVVVEPVAKLVKGSRPTRDDLVARVFSVKDDRRPSYPTVPPRPRVAGALPPSPITAGPAPDTSYVRGVPAEPARRAVRGELPPARTVREGGPGSDTSGPIKPTLPEHYTREQAMLDEIIGSKREPMAVVPAERNFILRWLADDLREISYQPSSRMKGVHRQDVHTAARSQEEARRVVYSPRVAGTHTQEMFHAAGIKGTRAEIAERLDTFVRTGKGSPKIEALADAMREAWDGQRFDFDLVSEPTMQRLGIRRRDLRDPSSMPHPNDQPEIYDQFFRSDAAVDDVPF